MGVGTIKGHWGVSGDVRSLLGASRECRYSGARRGIDGIRGHLGAPSGFLGVRGLLGGCQQGISGCRECQGCIWGWQGV